MISKSHGTIIPRQKVHGTVFTVIVSKEKDKSSRGKRAGGLQYVPKGEEGVCQF